MNSLFSLFLFIQGKRMEDLLDQVGGDEEYSSLFNGISEIPFFRGVKHTIDVLEYEITKYDCLEVREEYSRGLF